MNRRNLGMGALASVAALGTRSAMAGGGSRGTQLDQCQRDIEDCKTMLTFLVQNIQTVTQQQAANSSPQIVSAGGGPISVGGIRQCETNTQGG